MENRVYKTQILATITKSLKFKHLNTNPFKLTHSLKLSPLKLTLKLTHSLTLKPFVAHRS